MNKNKINGYKPNYPIFDELSDLRIIYSDKQLQKLWNECTPKIERKYNLPIITGTP